MCKAKSWGAANGHMTGGARQLLASSSGKKINGSGARPIFVFGLVRKLMECEVRFSTIKDSPVKCGARQFFVFGSGRKIN